MGLDIRWPIGLLFSLVGALLVIYGLATISDAEVYRRSLGINVNLRWGLVLLVFGGSCSCWPGARAASPPSRPRRKRSDADESAGPEIQLRQTA